MLLPSLKRRRVKRNAALISALSFAWSFVLAAPAQAMAQVALQPTKHPGVRMLTEREMDRIVGSVAMHFLDVSAASGSTYPWEATSGGTNTGNGNKLTSIPVVAWTARGGLPVSFTLNHNSQSAHDSELGYKWTHSFDIFLVASGTGGDLTVHWGDDLAYTFTMNVDGSYSPPTGIYDSLVKNVDGTYTLTKPDQTVYHFKTNQYCDTITDENANTIAIAYNAGNFVTSITDPTSRAITLSYDANNCISTVTDPLSRVWTLHYTSGNLTSVDEPTINSTVYSWSVGYNSAHDITTLTSPGGRSTSATYNSDDSLASETDGCGNTTTWTETSTGTTVRDANGHSTVYSYTSGRVSSVVDGASQTESYAYDTSNNKTQVTDKRGYNWNYTFDSAGNVLTAEDPYTNTTTNTYNSHNKLLTSTDPLGHVTTTIAYDTQDNPTSVTDALSDAVTTTYTTHGRPDTVTDALSHTVASFTYDTDGNCTLVVDANSNQTSATFDGLGHKLTATDQLSHTTTWTLDAWERPTSVATPAGTTNMAYNADDLATSVTDDNAHATTQTYDNNGRPLVNTKANGDTFTNTYDGTGQKGLLSSTTDGNSHTITYAYTARDQKSSASYPDSTSESWTYDANGAVASHTGGRGYTTTYTLDHAGRLTGIAYTHDTSVSLVYDAAGRKTSMTDATGTTGWTYDNANRCTQIAQPNGTVTYGFDNANRRTSMAISGTGSWTYSFDSANRLTSTTNPNSETTTFTLDNAGRITRQDNGNTTYVLNSFDSANRPTEIQTKNSSATVLSDIQYGYDGVNVTSRTDSDGTVTTFGYDASDQLTSEVRDNSHSTGYSIAYTYDHNQNRTSKTLGGVTDPYSYDNHEKLTSTSSKSYGYDNDGNCTSVTVGSNTTTLTYDDSDRVTGITYPSTATNSFVYNGEDLRVSKTDSAGTSAVITDGTAPASPVLKDARAVYTPGLSERASGTSKWYHTDALGSTRGITNGSQTVTDAVLYDAFGVTVSRTGSTATPFDFVGAQGYQSDADSGLQLLGHRYYDPSIGRFISSDPAKAGTNWNAYCEDNPLGATDPQGLDKYLDTWNNLFGGGDGATGPSPTPQPAPGLPRREPVPVPGLGGITIDPGGHFHIPTVGGGDISAPIDRPGRLQVTDPWPGLGRITFPINNPSRGTGQIGTGDLRYTFPISQPGEGTIRYGLPNDGFIAYPIRTGRPSFRVGIGLGGPFNIGGGINNGRVIIDIKGPISIKL